jgi:hypothetical protein
MARRRQGLARETRLRRLAEMASPQAVNQPVGWPLATSAARVQRHKQKRPLGTAAVPSSVGPLLDAARQGTRNPAGVWARLISWYRLSFEHAYGLA